VRRRDLLKALIAPVALPVLGGCPGAQTPLSHLHGQEWVTGAYEMYGDAYLGVQSASEETSFDAYAMLAQKGVTALDTLQLREVPFHARVGGGGESFAIERDLPERLTFRADMDEEDRRRATEIWERGRAHIHTDYLEIRRLNWALTRLLGQLQRLRMVSDQAEEEQFRITRQVESVKEGDLPFELPYAVSAADYERVLVLLVERLDDDRQRLAQLETAVVAVGLTARATDSRSLSLAPNLRKVLRAVERDATASTPRPSTYPRGDEGAARLARGRKLMAAIRKSEAYEAWLDREREAWLRQIGGLLTILDAVTGIPISRAYQHAVTVFAGDADYLDYLKLVSALSPSPELSSAVDDAVTLTEKVRTHYRQGRQVVDSAQAGDVGALLNTGTAAAKAQIGKQLVFFADAAEHDAIRQELDESPLMKRALPSL
jgi:hypothetical protein